MKKLFVFLLIAMPFMACAMKRKFEVGSQRHFLATCKGGDVESVRLMLQKDESLV